MMDNGVKVMPRERKTSPLRYAIGMFGTSIPINMFKAYAMDFYVVKLGLSTSHYALILFLYTFVDAIDNPVYGFLSDRTRTRWGRRRPWLILGAPLLALAFILFYNPPVLAGEAALFTYMLLTYILTGTLDSLINANYGALFPELFQGEAVRAKTNAMRQTFQLVAMVISLALTPVIAGALGYANTAIIYSVLAVAVILFCAMGCREDMHVQETKRPPLLSSLKALAVNPLFWVFGLCNAFYSAAMAMVLQSVPLFVRYTLGLQGVATMMLQGIVLLLAVASMALWAFMVRRFTLMRTWRGALILLGVSFLPLYFMNSLVGAIVASAFVGIGMAGVMATMDLIGARIMDEDTRKYGLRREGIYSSAMGVLNRLSGLFVSLGVLLASSLYGFESGDIPGPNPGGAARFMLALFPAMAMVVSCVFSWVLNFREEKAVV
jgi:GPH family glycoside/pentoside/hexuronide:cation symporter